MVGEFLESLEDLGQSEDADLVGDVGLVVLDLSSHGSGKTGLKIFIIIIDHQGGGGSREGSLPSYNNHLLLARNTKK